LTLFIASLLSPLIAAAHERSTRYPVQLCESAAGTPDTAVLFTAGLDTAALATDLLADLEADFSDGLEDLADLAGSAVLLVLGSEAKVGRAVKRNRAKRETVNCFGNMIHVIAS
jgi:hypothetical protein